MKKSNTFSTHYTLKRVVVDKMPAIKTSNNNNRKDSIDEEEEFVNQVFEIEDKEEDSVVKEESVELAVDLNEHGREQVSEGWEAEADRAGDYIPEFITHGYRLSGESKKNGKKVLREYPNQPRTIKRRDWKNQYEVAKPTDMEMINNMKGRRLVKKDGVIYDLMTSDLPESIEPRKSKFKGYGSE